MTLKFDFQQNEVSFFFFLSHLSALSCIMIDTEGNVFGYVTGQLTADMMESIVTQTMTGQRVS